MKSIPRTYKAAIRLYDGFAKRGRIVNVFIFIWINLAMYDCAIAIPREPTIVKELRGVVVAAVWRSGFKFTRVDLDELRSISRATERKISVEPHWIVILSDIHGIDARTIQEFSAYFRLNEPWDNIYDYKQPKDGRLLLWIPGGKDMKLTNGDRIELSAVTFGGWQEGADMVYKTISVEDGNMKTIHKFPKPKASKKPPAKKRKQD